LGRGTRDPSSVSVPSRVLSQKIKKFGAFWLKKVNVSFWASWEGERELSTRERGAGAIAPSALALATAMSPLQHT